MIASHEAPGRKSGASPFALLLEEAGDQPAILPQKVVKGDRPAATKNTPATETTEHPDEKAEDTEAQSAGEISEQGKSPESQQPPIQDGLPLNSPKPSRGGNPSSAQRFKPASEIFAPFAIFTSLPLFEIPPSKEKQSLDSGNNETAGAAAFGSGASQRHPAVDSAAVEIRIRDISDHAEEMPSPDAGESTPQTTPSRRPPIAATEALVNPISGNSQPGASTPRIEITVPPQAPNALLHAPGDPAAKQSEPAPTPAREPEASNARPAVPIEPPRSGDTAQPVRAVSLEFSPDGAADIKLRLSERSGDVHITLHSADPSLSGRLHAGVNDLIGWLSNAGYEAEAWTAGQGQRQHREPEERRSRRPDGDVQSGEGFGGLLQQSEF